MKFLTSPFKLSLSKSFLPRLIPLLLAIGAAAGEDSAKSPKPPEPAAKDAWAFLPDVVATIGDETITRQAVVEHLNARVPGLAARPDVSPKMRKDLARQATRGMIDTRILLDLAAKSGITPSKELVKRHIESQKKELTQEDLENIENTLMATGLTIKEYEDQMCESDQYREGAVITEWIKEEVEPRFKIDDEAVKAYYEKHRDRFRKPPSVTASHILITPEGESPEERKAAREKAETVLAKLRDGADFGELAERESACPSGKRNKGNLGVIFEGTMVPEFEKAVFALKVGELSAVVETRFGFHLIKATDRTKATVPPLDEVVSIIRATIKTEKEAKVIEEILNAEKEKRDVKINL